MKKIKKIIILLLSLILIGSILFYFNVHTYFFPEEKQEEKIERIENSQKPVSLSPEEKFDLIRFFQKNDIFLSYYYEKIAEIPLSYLANTLIDWEKNPSLTEEQLKYIHNEYATTNWLQNLERGQVEYYISISAIYDHYQTLIFGNFAPPDSTDCMIYLEKYEIYIPVCEKEWRQNYEPLLAEKNQWGRIYYPNRVFLHQKGYYIFEIITYDLNSAYQYLNKNEMLNRFITKQISATEAELEKINRSTLFMKEDGNQWLFLRHREAQ